MCCKLCKKLCCMVVMAVLIGGVIYFLCSLKDDNGTEGTLVKEMQEKKNKLKNACCSMKDQTKNIADEVKFAAQYTAEEMKDGWKNTGEAVKNAAENIKDDVKDMKESAESIFESGENA